MGISLGGISFRIGVRGTKRSVSHVTQITQALKALGDASRALPSQINKAASQVTKASGQMQRAAQKAGKAVQTYLYGKSSEQATLPDRVVRARIRMLDRIAREERRRRQEKQQEDARAHRDQLAMEQRAFRLKMQLMRRLQQEQAKARRQEQREAERVNRAVMGAARSTTRAAIGESGSRLDRMTPEQAQALSRRKVSEAKRLTAEAAQAERKALQAARDVERAKTLSQRQEATKRVEAARKEAGQKAALANKAAQQAIAAQRRVSAASQRMAVSGREVFEAFASVLTMLGGARLVHIVGRWTLLAARVENLNTVMRNVGAVARYTNGELTAIEEGVRKLGITTQTARTVMTRFAQNNLEVADALRISRIAQDAAVVAGLNSSETAERMAIAVQRLDTRMLRNIGILINLRQEYHKFGQQTGRVETSLTAAEKQQIALNAVIRQGAALAGNYEKALGDVYKQWTSLDRYQEEAARNLGQQLVPAFEVLVTVLTKGLKAVGSWEGGLKTTVVTMLAVAGVTVTLAGAIGTVSVAMHALNLQAKAVGASLRAAFLHPVALGIFATVAALTAAVTILSSIEQNRRLVRRRRLAEIESQVADQERARKLVGQVRELEAAKDRSVYQDEVLRSKKQALIDMLDEEDRKWLDTSMSVDEYTEKLKELAGLDVSTPLEEQIQASRAKLRELETMQLEAERREREAVAAEYARRRRQIVSFATTQPIAQTGQFAEEIGEERSRLRGLENIFRTRRLRELEEIDRLSETAYSVTKRLESTLQTREVSQAKGPGLRGALELRSQLRRIIPNVETRADIFERSRLGIEQAGVNLVLAAEKTQDAEQIAAAEEVKEKYDMVVGFYEDLGKHFGTLKGSMEELPLDEVLDKFEEFVRSNADLVAGTPLEGLVSTTEANLSRLADTNTALQKIFDSRQAMLREVAFETSQLREEYKALEEGIAPTVIRTWQEQNKEARQYAIGLQKVQQAIRDVERDIARLEERRTPENEAANLATQAVKRRQLEDLQMTGRSLIYRQAAEAAVNARRRAAELRLELRESERELRGRSLDAQLGLSKSRDADFFQTLENTKLGVTGVSDAVAGSLAAVRENLAESAKAIIAYEKTVDELEQKEQELLVTRQGARDEATRRFLSKELEQLRDHARKVRELHEQEHEARLEQQRSNFREMLRAQESQLESMRKGVESTTKAIAASISQTEQFIGKKGIELFGERHPAQSKLMGAFGEFAGAIRGAGTRGQVQSLQDLAYEQFNMMAGEVRAFGGKRAGEAFATEALSFLDELSLVAESREVEIRQRDMQLEAEIEQVTLLRGIFRSMQDVAAGLAKSYGDSPATQAILDILSRGPDRLQVPYGDIPEGVRMRPTSRRLPGFSPEVYQRRQLEGLRSGLQPTTPFDGGIGKGFSQINAAGAKSNAALEGFSAEVTRGLQDMLRNYEQQQSVLQQATAEVQSTRQRLADQEKAARQAFAGRGL